MRRKKDAKKTDRKRGVSFQEKYNKEEEGEERRRGEEREVETIKEG